MTNGYVYNAVITNVVDGDTVDANVDLGFTVWVSVRFRLFGIDTMELNDKVLENRKLGLAAKQYIMNNLLGKKVTLKSHKTDKYGRWLADIFVNGKSVSQELINEGMAVEYFGKSK